MAQTKTTGGSSRDQLNLVLSADSSLARRLRAAEKATGQPRTRIARDILDAFLDAWLAAELAKRRVLDAARSSAENESGDVIRLRPRYAGPDRPAPEYAESVAARRHISPRVARGEIAIDTVDITRYVPRRRSEPVQSESWLDDSDD